MPGQKAQFHQPSGDIVRDVKAIQDAFFTGPEIGQGQDAGAGPPAAAVETHLQHTSSMGRVRNTVNHQLRLDWSDIGYEQEMRLSSNWSHGDGRHLRGLFGRTAHRFSAKIFLTSNDSCFMIVSELEILRRF
jgi:hypothetical protein